MNTDPFYILKAPVITEESTLQTNTQGKYVFKVDPRANKKQIREAIEKVFGVEVVNVNTMNYAGKLRSGMRRSPGRKADWKKAVVTLAPGQTIDLL